MHIKSNTPVPDGWERFEAIDMLGIIKTMEKIAGEPRDYGKRQPGERGSYENSNRRVREDLVE